MQSSGKLMILAAAVCLVALCCVTASSEPVPAGSNQALERTEFQLPKLFDFQYYKERFGKRYSSLVEELARKAYFVARAFRSFVSGMNYKYRKSTYYLAVNHMSDATPEEIEARKNKRQAEKERELNNVVVVDSEQQRGTQDELPEFIPAEGENYEAEVSKLLREHANEPGYKELLEGESGRHQAGGSSRKRRDVAAVTGGDRREGPRDFSLNELMAPGVNEPAEPLPAGVQVKLTDDIASNNPNYQPPEIETQGLNDGHADLSGWIVTRQPSRMRRDKRKLGTQLKGSLNSLVGYFFSSPAKSDAAASKKQVRKIKDYDDDDDDDDDERDLMYFDHRDSECLLTPRDQGTCGSCYAFASIALMEWLHCTKTGKLVQFSEQYMVDCGNGRWDDRMSGCEGATDYSVFKYIHNFGLERAKAYPYHERVLQCPYDETTDLTAAGYLRMELGDFTKVPVALWEDYIEYAPLYMSIASPADYQEYSGGVHNGLNCGERGDHAQLLVGHGREDGQDYWLIRNSYGPKWGDRGYFKLSKDAPKRCIDEQIGYALGTKDARIYTVEPEKNHENHELRRQKIEEGAESSKYHKLW